MKWEPIETAPKDRTRILIPGWYGGNIVRWTQNERYELGWVGYDEEGIFTARPTHWMPLPKPPTSEDK